MEISRVHGGGFLFGMAREEVGVSLCRSHHAISFPKRHDRTRNHWAANGVRLPFTAALFFIMTQSGKSGEDAYRGTVANERGNFPGGGVVGGSRKPPRGLFAIHEYLECCF